MIYKNIDLKIQDMAFLPSLMHANDICQVHISASPCFHFYTKASVHAEDATITKY